MCEVRGKFFHDLTSNPNPGNLQMKMNIRIKAVLPGASIFGMMLFLGAAIARGDALTQTVNEVNGTGNWNQAIWGTPPAVPVATNDYIVELLGGTNCAVRTSNTSVTAQSFLGSHLILTNGGILFTKHAGAACNANLVLDGGQII